MTGLRESTGRVTISDIAERAGVSISAVSFALNGRKGVSQQTRERVNLIATELGWSPTSAARSLAGAKTDTFGLVLARDPENLGVEAFYMQFLAGLESELVKRSYGLLLQVVPSMEAELATMTTWRNSRRVDGMILTDLIVDDPRITLASEPGALPTVVVGDPSVARGLTSIWTDDAASIREAVDHLTNLGHRHIARVSGLAPLIHTRIRDAAFEAAVRSRGVSGTVLATDYTPKAGARVTLQALRSDSAPTAFIYDNDVMAVAALSVFMQQGLRVPEDISVIGWDGSVLCEHTYPRLSTLNHDVVAFGAHTARRLFDVIDGAEPGVFLDSTSVLVQRASTGAARTASSTQVKRFI